MVILLPGTKTPANSFVKKPCAYWINYISKKPEIKLFMKTDTKIKNWLLGGAEAGRVNGHPLTRDKDAGKQLCKEALRLLDKLYQQETGNQTIYENRYKD